MNSLSAIGNVGRQAETRFLPDGTCIASFSFALTSGYGEKKVTTWLNCSLFGKRAETLAPMLLKGTQIGITGEILQREYVTSDGIKKTSLDCRVNDVTLLGKKSNTTEQKPAAYDVERHEDYQQDDGGSIPF